MGPPTVGSSAWRTSQSLHNIYVPISGHRSSPAPSGIGRHRFPKKMARLAYSKQLNAKDSCESAKITPGKLTIRYNHLDGTGRFCAKAAPCHKLLKSIL